MLRYFDFASTYLLYEKFGSNVFPREMLYFLRLCLVYDISSN